MALAVAGTSQNRSSGKAVPNPVSADRIPTHPLGDTRQRIGGLRLTGGMEQPARSADDGDGLDRESSLLDESQLVTGDEVLVELTAVVEYRIGSSDNLDGTPSRPRLPTTVAGGGRERDSRNRGHRFLADLMTDRRKQLQTDCLDAARASATPYRLGLEIVTSNCWTSIPLDRSLPPTARLPMHSKNANG
ncbi:MAG: hypothetical protein Ct9H300mP1_13530 [Planctomycetaceae bacterium]|nr:MAG: hypothetical protein Ct9H300mP1_13530 [Planctomycetaceae bacterium]